MKKNPKGFDELEKEYFKVNKEQNNHKEFYEYIWELVSMSKGYGFENIGANILFQFITGVI